MIHWVPFNNAVPLIKECCSALLYDLYCCDNTVNWSYVVNILHSSFASWLRSWRGRNHSAVLIRIAQTLVGPLSLQVNWMTHSKDIIWLQAAMTQCIRGVLIFTKTHLVLAKNKFAQYNCRCIYGKFVQRSNAQNLPPQNYPSKRWWIHLATAMHAIYLQKPWCYSIGSGFHSSCC